MAKKYIIQEEKGLGGCNLVIWDVLLIVAATTFIVADIAPFEIHTVFRILIGIVVAVVFIVLTKIKFVGKIIQIGVGVFWAYIAWNMIDVFFGVKKLLVDDPIWAYTIMIVLGIFFVGLHIASFAEFKTNNLNTDSIDYNNDYSTDTPIQFIQSNQDIQAEQVNDLIERFNDVAEDSNYIVEKAFENMSKGRKTDELEAAFMQCFNEREKSSKQMDSYINSFNRSKSDYQRQEIVKSIKSYIDNLEQYARNVRRCLDNLPQASPQTEKTEGFNPFAGCDTLDKLEKRYKSLARSFHPDMETGDTESMQLLNQQYEELRDQFKQNQN